ncbi:MAG TPA: vWA domain-containing protein [Ktedonobacteraceae bacterium]|nr:vWA domain-containing protein [Ktedonobacteraceae bacterium]
MKREMYKPEIRYLQFISLMLFVFLYSLALPQPVAARTTSIGFDVSSPAECRQPAEVNDKSLLIVLLDRSGSLTLQPSPTDPNLYSTSVTKALTDLWPGDMAVIPFSGDTPNLPILGPATLSNPVQRADLKKAIEGFPIGGDTPLEPAMQEALDLLHRNGTPAGSRVVIITDGNPTGIGNNDGPHQENTIRTQLIPQYCQQGIPVRAFGLTIDPNTPDGQDATRLLSDIANGTGTIYTNVTSPEQLGLQVTKLYAEWLHLNFQQINGQGSNFAVPIDRFAQQVAFVSFRSAENYQITLIDPNNQPVTTGVQKSTPPDRHYEIDNLLVVTPGTYTINTGGDPNAQVYVLINSPLHVQLVAPPENTLNDASKRIDLKAAFFDGTAQITPTASDGAQIKAFVTFLVNGHPVGSTNEIVMTQQNGPFFSGKTLVYKQPGELQIDLIGTYDNIQRESTVTLRLRQPAPAPSPPSPPPLWLFILLGGLVLCILIALFWWFRGTRPKDFRGWICSVEGEPRQVDLNKVRKAVIRSDKLALMGDLNFGTAIFELQFQKNKQPVIKVASGNTTKIFVGPPDAQALMKDQRELNVGDYITPEDGETVAYTGSPQSIQDFF